MGEVKAALDDVYDFFYNVNKFLVEKGWDRLEETLSPASLSGMLSEMVVQGVSKRSATVTKNQHHNGHPDLVPSGLYPNNAVLRGQEGIEVKASRYRTGWQGHNIESGWVIWSGPKLVRGGHKMVEVHEQFVTVGRASELLRVSKSTLWRWIRQGEMPAYRFGYRRVLIKQEDLDRMIFPARGEKGILMLQKERERLARPLSEAAKKKALAALDAAEQLQQELFAVRRGTLFSSSAELLNHSRDERTEGLS